MARYDKKKRLCIGLAIFMLMGRVFLRKRRRKRKWCVRPWATQERRDAQGMGCNLIPELRNTDVRSFRNFFR